MSPTTPLDKPRSTWVRLSAVLFVLSCAGVAWYWAGDLSEQVEPEFADYLWHPWEWLLVHEDLVGVMSTLVFVAAGVALVVARRRSEATPSTLAAVAVAALFAAWLGLGYRVLTAGVNGANIGGGGILLLTPLFAVVTLALVLWLARRGSARVDGV
jgi:hypothetical protein